MFEFLNDLGFTPNPKCLVFSAITVLSYYSLPVCKDPSSFVPDASRAATTFVVSAGLVKFYHFWAECIVPCDSSYMLAALTTAMYYLLPCRYERYSSRVALLIATTSYVGMAWYDSVFKCQKRLRANPLSLLKPLKPKAKNGFY